MVEALVRLGQRALLAGRERRGPEQARVAHQVRQLVDVRDVGGHHRNGMHASGIRSAPTRTFMLKYHWLPFLV